MKSSTKSASKSNSLPDKPQLSPKDSNCLLCSLLCALLYWSGGCSKPFAQAQASTSVVAANPVRVNSLLPKRVGLSERLLTESYPRFAFLPKGEQPGLIFVNMKRDNGVSPYIIIAQGSQYELVALDDERFENHGWIQGYASSDRRHFWAVTDSVVESPSWELHIVHSSDGGVTWAVAAPLRKPYYLAALHSLRMRPDGLGELIVRHQDDAANPVSNVLAGYYSYATRDWGNSWSSPMYEPDVILEPDSVPADQHHTRVPLSVYLQSFPADTNRAP